MNDRLDHVGKLRAQFARIATEPVTAPLTLQTFTDHTFSMACTAMLAKCIEYNVAANHEGALPISHAILSAGLRGICEDLIALKYLKRFDPTVANEIVLSASMVEIHTGVERQRDFIYRNSPTQLFVGANRSGATVIANVKSAKARLKAAWHKAGLKDRPTIKAMAEATSLERLYSFLYFATSNHVHHNIRTLFITAWSPEEGPVGFSSTNLADYYNAFNSFYGALLYCGVVWSGLPIHTLPAHQERAAEIEAILQDVQWWPETVTRDEMNMGKISAIDVLNNLVMREMEPATGLSIFEELKIAI